MDCTITPNDPCCSGGGSPCTAGCEATGYLYGGRITVSSACLNQVLTFTADGVGDSGGLQLLSDCGLLYISPGTPTLTWVITLPDGTTTNGSGSVATITATAPGDYSATFTATVARPCAPGPLTIGPATATVGTLDLEFVGVAEAAEESPGGFLCVNDDDDDNSGVPDKDQTGAILLEDDLHKVKINVSGLDPSLTVTLSAPTGGTGSSMIKVYEQADRSVPVSLPASWPAGSVPPSAVYVEGIAPSAAAADVELKLEAVGAGGMCEDIVKLTMTTVQLVEWVAIDSPLDANPNPPPSGVGKRIFPGKATPTDALNRQKVKVRATVTPPVSGVAVFFRSFDVDDPSANTAPVDNETQQTDNRGTFNQPVPTSILTNAQGQADVELVVSMQPGDNFKVVASCLTDYFDNLQAKQNDSPLARVEHTQGWFVPSSNITELLTVWRKLHVEVDSMGAVTGNEISSTFTDIVGTGTALTEVSGVGTPGLDDGSKNLDDNPQENGRFENGTLIIGAASTITISPVTGNGNNHVVFPAANIAGLPFSAIDNDFFTPPETMSGTITQVTKSGSNFVWTLNILASDETPIDWPDFVGGELSVGGGANIMIVAASAAATTLTTDALNIPCIVRDDDNLMNGQDVPTPDTSGIADIYAAVYIEPAFDTGANTTNSPFHLNSQRNVDHVTHRNETRGGGNSSNLYWVVMVKNGYQTDKAPSVNTSKGDNDPNNEGTWRAAGSSGGGSQPGAILLEESIRDWIAASVANGGAGGVDPDTTGAPNRQTRRQEILNHELGHNFGLEHTDGLPTTADPFGGVMRASNTPRQASTFTQTSLDKIRTKNRPG